MRNQKWRSHRQPPKRGQLVLGWDEFYGDYYLVTYDGQTNDMGEPSLQPEYGDDMYITSWMHLPEPPKGKRVER